MPENKQLEEFRDKLVTRFSHLEYEIRTKRKTMPIEIVKSTVDTVLQTFCVNTINDIYNEMTGNVEVASDDVCTE